MIARQVEQQLMRQVSHFAMLHRNASHCQTTSKEYGQEVRNTKSKVEAKARSEQTVNAGETAATQALPDSPVGHAGQSGDTG